MRSGWTSRPTTTTRPTDRPGPMERCRRPSRLAQASCRPDSIASVTVTDTNSGGLAGAAAGGTYPLTPSAAVAGGTTNLANYDIHYAAGTLTVNAQRLDITANNDNKTYGQVKTYGALSTAFTTGPSQLQGTDSIASVTITDTNSGGLAGAAAGGTYPLTPSAAVAGGTTNLSNYDIHYAAGTLTVN